jgi:EAL domain-containing protein (putative c-di-GMP-specific phosphodiesterase class I)
VQPEKRFTHHQIDALHEIVEARQVAVAFQPIVDLRRTAVHAYEALTRVAHPLFSGPAELFAAAAAAGRVGELGRIHRENSLRLAPQVPLFLNIHPNEFDEGWLVRPDDPIFRTRSPVTLEITESVPLSYFAQCHSVLAEIRAKGVLLAIDDFGAGYSNLRYILDLDPAIVKLDRELVAGLRPGTRQERLIRAIVELCHRMEARVIAEGIETVGELEVVRALGVDYAQGYLLGRPACPPPDLTWPNRLF